MKRLLVINDLHVGSKYGIMPDIVQVEDPQTGLPETHLPNAVQQRLMYYWKLMMADIGRLGGVDACLVNGDAVDGCQKKSMGMNTWTNDLGVQANVAITMLKTIPSKNWFFTQGSEYHNIREMPVEKFIAEQMGGQFGNDLIIEIGGKRIHASHNVPVSKASWQYRSTPLARDMLLMALAKSTDEYGQIDCILRAHAHYFASVQFAHSIGIICPGWQTRTPFGVKIDAVSPPDVGYVLLEIDGENIDVRKRIWKVANSNSKVVTVQA